MYFIVGIPWIFKTKHVNISMLRNEIILFYNDFHFLFFYKSSYIRKNTSNTVEWYPVVNEEETGT